MVKKLETFRIGLGVYSIIVILLLSSSVYSFVSGPVMNPEEFIQVPEVEDVEWTIEGSTIYVDTSLTISNSGFFDFNNIELDFNMVAMNSSLMRKTKVIEKVPSGESVEVPLNFSIDYNDLTEEEIETLVFNQTMFDITASFSAEYPFSIMKFNLNFIDEIPWDGLIQEMDLKYEEAQIEDTENGDILSVPYEIQTADFLSGDAVIELIVEGEKGEYSTSEITIPLGRYHSDDITFNIGENEIEELLTNSQLLTVTANIQLNENFDFFEYITTYDWGAPFNDLTLDNIRYYAGRAEGDLSFINDSPQKLRMNLDIYIYDDSDNLIESKSISYTNDPTYILEPGEEFQDTISIQLDQIPEYAVIDFTEVNSGITYREVVSVY
ncbi:MAG: hypothetical protein ACOC85_03440 [Thermoplasmatota archaeon]